MLRKKNTEGRKDFIKNKVDQVFDSLPSRTGFIFNLGHGVLPETDDIKLKQIVEYIHGK